MNFHRLCAGSGGRLLNREVNRSDIVFLATGERAHVKGAPVTVVGVAKAVVTRHRVAGHNVLGCRLGKYRRTTARRSSRSGRGRGRRGRRNTSAIGFLHGGGVVGAIISGNNEEAVPECRSSGKGVRHVCILPNAPAIAYRVIDVCAVKGSSR